MPWLRLCPGHWAITKLIIWEFCNLGKVMLPNRAVLEIIAASQDRTWSILEECSSHILTDISSAFYVTKIEGTQKIKEIIKLDYLANSSAFLILRQMFLAPGLEAYSNLIIIFNWHLSVIQHSHVYPHSLKCSHVATVSYMIQQMNRKMSKEQNNLIYIVELNLENMIWTSRHESKAFVEKSASALPQCLARNAIWDKALLTLRRL